MRAAAYVRISRDDAGEELGIGRQEADARQLAERRGWEVVAVFSDNDVTASGKRRRPGWLALLDAIRAGTVDAVAAYSSSRLYRNLRDLTTFIDLVNERGVEVATAVSGNIDLTTADGRMMARMLAVIDQREWEVASERRRRQMREKIDRGEWLGGFVPYGYRLVDQRATAAGGLVGGRLVPDEAEAAVLRDAARRLLNGESLGSVARRWAAEGVRTRRGKVLTVNGVRQMLSRPLDGVLAETDSEDLLRLFESRRTGPRNEGRRLLTGLLTCSADGRPMVHRPQGGVRCYVCLGPDFPPEVRVHMRVGAEAVERHVVREAALRHVPRPQELVDLEAPLYEERRRVVAEMDRLAESTMPVRMIERAGLRLQRELDRIDAELRAAPADTEAEAAGWGAYVGFRFVDLADSNPRLRAWLQTMVDEVVVSPGRKGANRFEPDRVGIVWRDGVELRP